MTYAAQETSLDDGAPVELFRFFVVGKATITTITTASKEIEYQGETYIPAAITRTQNSKSSEKTANSMTVTIPYWEEGVQTLARSFISNAPSGRVEVKIARAHMSESPVNFIQIFEGYVAGAALEDAKMELLCRGIRNIFNKEGPRMKWMTSCNHELYDNNCALLEDAFTEFNLTVTGVSSDGLTVTIAGLQASRSPQYTNGDFNGGKLVVGDGVEYRMILTQVGDVLTLRYPFIEINVGDSVDLSLGCLHNVSDCKNKFGNILNYGGVPYTPSFNPFGTDINRF